MFAEANLNLYITAEHPCPYLPDHHATNLLVDPGFKMTGNLYAKLLDRGFRRSGDAVYRPHCQHCQACVATRIPVADFTPNRSQQRNWQRNRDLQAHINHDQGFKPEYGALYNAYINHRHPKGGMDADGADAFASFLLGQWCPTLLVEWRCGGQLLGVAAVDKLRNGLSAVYTFFEPVQGGARGLGTYAVLWQIAYAREHKLPYVYPGYWIGASPKMAYKTQFQPMEGLVQGQWVVLPKQVQIV